MYYLQKRSKKKGWATACPLRNMKKVIKLELDEKWVKICKFAFHPRH